MLGQVEHSHGRRKVATLAPLEQAVIAQQKIEDLVAASSETDALCALQDFVADFVPSLREAVMQLRNSYDIIRYEERSMNSDATAVNRIRNEILELAYDAVDFVESKSEGATRTAPTGIPTSVEDELGMSAAPAALDAEAAQIIPRKKQKKKRRRSSSNGADTDIVCRLEEVGRTFGKGRFKMDQISLDIRRGEIIAIAGRNASGKTTLLNMMLGDLLPTTGKISYPALEGTGLRLRRNWTKIKSQIGSVPQLPEKWFGRLRHNLNYIAAVNGTRDQDLESFIDWHLSRYELFRFRHSRWDEISGGYKIRFELVRALLSQPKMLVLDEPLAYLDVVARDRFLRDIRAIADSRDNPMPIIITSQHLSEVEAIADHILLLDDGVLKYQGSVDDLQANQQYRVLEIAVDAPLSAIETALSGAQLQGIEPTVEGYILAIPKSASGSSIFTRLSAAFGDDFTMMRDITGSVRAIMSDVGT
nr:ABC transporter ATP-binding protein [Hyphomonas sp. Mor2]